MHLLLVSCSSKKKPLHNATAISIYDGVFYSVIKKCIREHPEIKNQFQILIVSAKYGLICPEEKIDCYDLKMTPQIAASQKLKNTEKLQAYILEENITDVTVIMGKCYLQSIDFSSIPIPTQFISGEIGQMLHGLKEWLLDVC